MTLFLFLLFATLLVAAFILATLHYLRQVFRGWQHRPPQCKKEFFGHPWSPTGELWKQLPIAPDGYAWETKVMLGADKSFYLHLALVNLEHQIDYAQTQVNITRFDDGSTWETHYLDQPVAAKEHFDRYVVRRLTQWAQDQITTLRIGEVYEYRISKNAKKKAV